MPPPSERSPGGSSTAGAAAPGADAGAVARWLLQLPRGRCLPLGGAPTQAGRASPGARRPLLMGVLNLTPDSFSDGGALCRADGTVDVERAVERALGLLAEGAELLDLGAESTRPAGPAYGAGAATVPADEELRRLLPVLERLRGETEAVLSVDTRKGAVARAALAAGADLINDVGALADPALAAAVAASGCPVVLMHSRGDLATMQQHARYDDVVAEVRSELGAALARAAAAGIAAEQTVLDPGIGFAKAAEHNLTLLARLDALAELGRPLLVGASRKSFIGRLTGAGPADRLAGSLAAVAWAARQGAAMVRVHDVAATAQFLAVWQAVQDAGATA